MIHRALVHLMSEVQGANPDSHKKACHLNFLIHGKVENIKIVMVK